MSISDQDQWLKRLKGDPLDRDQAIAELRVLLLRGLSRSLPGRYGGGLQAEDVVQEALVKILDGLDSFEGRSKFTTWAMTIATRVGISELRKRYTKNISLNHIQQGEDWNLDVAAKPLADDRSSERERIMRQLYRAIDQDLTDRQRFAIRALLEGIPVEEIARRTDSNRNAVYKLVHDARLRLRAGLEESGISAEEVQAIIA